MWKNRNQVLSGKGRCSKTTISKPKTKNNGFCPMNQIWQTDLISENFTEVGPALAENLERRNGVWAKYMSSINSELI